MAKTFHNKINILKALAIMLVVSGHLEFSLIPMFPPYSFQLALFFFIAGMLFNEKYSFIEFIKRRFRSLILPYILYFGFYLIITIAITPIIGKFWGLPITLKNELIMPFLTGHQLGLIYPLWFVPQLFTSLIVFKVIDRFINKNTVKIIFFVLLALLAIQLEPLNKNLYLLYLQRTIFSLLFIHLGHLYTTKIESKYNIFNSKIFFSILILQSFLWLTNKDYTPADGIGLSYILVWGDFDNWIVPIITSITGIWMSLFVVEVSYNYIKNWDFLHKIGNNTYHIMANHLLIFNLITYSLLAIKGIPFDIKNNSDIYWFYAPLKTTYLYFIAGIAGGTYIGEFLKLTKKLLTKKDTKVL